MEDPVAHEQPMHPAPLNANRGSRVPTHPAVMAGLSRPSSHQLAPTVYSMLESIDYSAMAKKKKQYYIGYAREWAGGLSLDEQIARLKAFGCWNVWAESGDDTSIVGRQLSIALIDTRPGDYFVVVDLACLGAASRLAHVFTELQRNSVDLFVLADGLDSRGPDGERYIPEALQLLRVLQNIKSQAIRDGLAEARQQGRIGGRRPVVSAQKLAAANHLISAGQLTMKQIAKKLGVSRSSLYNRGLSAGTLPKKKQGPPTRSGPRRGADDRLRLVQGHLSDSRNQQQW